MEKARLKEWEESRKQELINHRSREDEKVLTLRARQEHLTKDVEELREKVTELTNNIADTRTGVTEVKTFIDGMRSGRDTKMADMKSLKQQLKDQNERLLKVRDRSKFKIHHSLHYPRHDLHNHPRHHQRLDCRLQTNEHEGTWPYHKRGPCQYQRS